MFRSITPQRWMARVISFLVTGSILLSGAFQGALPAGALATTAPTPQGVVAGQATPTPAALLDSTTISKYVTPLFIPPAMPTTPNAALPGTDYYEIAVRQFQQQILPQGMPATTVWGYGSVQDPSTFSYPARTIEATKGKPVSVKWINDLKDPLTGNYLPHLLPVDQTIHWANPPGGVGGRDMAGTDPTPYTGPVPLVTHLHGAYVTEENDGYPEAWYLPAATNTPAGYATGGSQYAAFKAESEAIRGQVWDPGTAVYHYSNDQRAATLWYHDHTIGMSRLNVYAGPVGFYLLRGGQGDMPIGTLPGPAPRIGDPAGAKYYEIPLVIQDKSFNDDGSLFFPDNRAYFEGLNPSQLQIPFSPDAAIGGASDIAPIWNPEFFGDTIVVNGRTWPYLEVEQKRYRFRLLNASDSRFFIFKLDNNSPFWQIGSDGGFLAAPLQLNEILLGPAERADIIVDFTDVPVGTNIVLQNIGPDQPYGGGAPGVDFPSANPATTGQVMQFRVIAAAGADPSTLATQLQMPAIPVLGAVGNVRKVSLNELDSSTVLASTDGNGNVVLDPAGTPFGPAMALLGTVNPDGTGNPLRFDDPITENPALNSTEVWEIYNFTMDAHPVHIHQVQFQVVNRQDIASGVVSPPAPGEAGFKDTVIAYPGAITRIKARFQLAGLYIWHCHILSHEDNEMMRPFRVGGPIVVPPPELNPLNQTPVPEPPNLFDYVTNKTVAIQLGKAFFWDMQAGSDGVQACASCHFSFGVDNRMKNTVNPGTLAGDTTFQVVGPNGTLQASDFPFHKRASPDDMQSSPILRDTNDVVGSQGVRRMQFVDIIPGSAVENVIPVPDPVFNVGGVNTRQVTGRQAPSVMDAVFNFTNFWDGRANFIFNGENPFGPADSNAGVWFNRPGGLVKEPVRILFASLASQATGPAMDSVEMSAAGRTFPHLGRKLMSLTPLGKQVVSHDDSVLGGLARSSPEDPTAKGLHTGYADLIRQAFHSELWNSSQPVTITLPNGQPTQFTQMEANFAFFWGMSIQLYEATMVSDQTPFDHWLGGDAAALTPDQQFGFSLFNGLGRCTDCHTGIEFSFASVANAAYVNNFAHNLIEVMPTSDGTETVYDVGFNNTSVTRTTDDVGRGGSAPFVNTRTGQHYPLSFSTLAELQAQGLLPFSTPILPLHIPNNFPVSNNGAFKVPGLRNVELTAPYFHNGSIMSLEDVVDFYVRGGNFPAANIADLDPAVGQAIPLLQGKESMHLAIVEFMKALTDPRVRAQSAPFDHPELFVPNGEPEILWRVPATNSSGVPVVAASLTLNPVVSPTRVATQTVTGTVEAGRTPSVTVNTSATVGQVTVTGTSWSAQITGLAEGANTVTASVVDSLNIQTNATTTITLDITPPSIAINPIATPTNIVNLTVSGAVELGALVDVSVNGAAPVVAARTGTSWSFAATLRAGPNTIAATARDSATNSTTVQASVVLDTTPPALTLTPVTSPTNAADQTLSGTVEAGARVQVAINGGPASQATVTGTAWSFVAPLTAGANALVVTAFDAAGNSTALPPATITRVVPAPSSFTVVLPEGWSLLSTPVTLAANSNTLDKVFDAASLANIEVMVSWSGGHWSQVTGTYVLTPLEALYIKVKTGFSSTATLVAAPEMSSPPSRGLVAGYNLVGPAPSLALDTGAFPAQAVDLALFSCAQAAGGLRGYTVVVSPNHNQASWTYVPGGQMQSLAPFKGYWVIMENPDTLYGFSTTPITQSVP